MMTRRQEISSLGAGLITGCLIGVLIGLVIASCSYMNPSTYNPTEAYKLYQESLDRETKYHLKEIERHNKALGISQ